MTPRAGVCSGSCGIVPARTDPHVSCRDLRQESGRQPHATWPRLSFVYNHYLFLACILVVLLAIALYLLRLRRIHRRHLRTPPLDRLWLQEVALLPGPGTGP